MNKSKVKKHLGINEHQWHNLLLMYKAGFATRNVMVDVDESSLLGVLVNLIHSGADYERIKDAFIRSMKDEAGYA